MISWSILLASNFYLYLLLCSVLNPFKEGAGTVLGNHGCIPTSMQGAGYSVTFVTQVLSWGMKRISSARTQYLTKKSSSYNFAAYQHKTQPLISDCERSLAKQHNTTSHGSWALLVLLQTPWHLGLANNKIQRTRTYLVLSSQVTKGYT